jgi:hypothetical protein
MEVKFGPSEKWIKTTDINQDEISHKNSRLRPFDHIKIEEILGRV